MSDWKARAQADIARWKARAAAEAGKDEQKYPGFEARIEDGEQTYGMPGLEGRWRLPNPPEGTPQAVAQLFAYVSERMADDDEVRIRLRGMLASLPEGMRTDPRIIDAFTIAIQGEIDMCNADDADERVTQDAAGIRLTESIADAPKHLDDEDGDILCGADKGWIVKPGEEDCEDCTNAVNARRIPVDVRQPTTVQGWRMLLREDISEGPWRVIYDKYGQFWPIVDAWGDRVATCASKGDALLAAAARNQLGAFLDLHEAHVAELLAQRNWLLNRASLKLRNAFFESHHPSGYRFQESSNGQCRVCGGSFPCATCANALKVTDS